MIYDIDFTNEAMEHLEMWRKSGQKKTLAKIVALVDELREHPTTGTGQPEQLRHNLSGYWSRRIDKANRLIYRIEDRQVIVTVLSLKGHYQF